MMDEKKTGDGKRSDVCMSYDKICKSIEQACKLHKISKPPRLVAVSKTKPANMILELYKDAGHRCFGENYVGELVGKSKELPEDIEWHFIGHLQSNKAKTVLRVPNLWVIETVDTVKLANKLNKACEDLNRRCRVFVQVNTSREANKSGVTPEDALDLARYIEDKAPNLELNGLMTIGSYEGDPTPFFKMLFKLREEICKELGRKEEELELSMGMSGDYRKAIKHGATSVRIGSAIFGARVIRPKE